MEVITAYIGVGLLGLVMGSFAGASVWRLRARQLLQDKMYGEPYDKAELKRLQPLNKVSTREDRSQCLHCGHTLAWYDLIPLVSWASTKGTCRYCHKPIGWFEPLIELGTAAAFVTFFHYWIAANGFSFLGILLLWLVIIVLLVILFAYDLKWFLLPDVIMVPLIVLALVIATFSVLTNSAPLPVGISTVGSVVVLGGLYLALWLVSKGRWVGFGDVKLGLALGLLLMDWKLAFLALFLANLIGTLIVLPGLIVGKLTRQTQVPFGPLLIAGFALALLSGQTIFTGYNSFSIWLSSTLLML